MNNVSTTISEIESKHAEDTSASPLRASLAEVGITGFAAECVIARSGIQRHANRIRAVYAAAVAAGDSLGLEPHYWLCLDMAGVGGAKLARHRPCRDSVEGLDGSGTARVPGFPGTSKQSRSGAAWSAARDAAVSLCIDSAELEPGSSLCLDPTVLMPGVETEYDRALWPYKAWVQSLAYQILTGTFACPDGIVIVLDARHWAELFNAWESFEIPTEKSEPEETEEEK
ncbi:MAG: hypothetical protein EOM24_33755 [Chloroflexia bacterium]|nr:hypothetical protein [Chloroflexia bacterium]